MKILRKDRTHHTKTLEKPGKIAGMARRRAEKPEEDQKKNAETSCEHHQQNKPTKNHRKI